MVGDGARVVLRKGAYRALVGKSEEKRQLGRLRCRWEYNIRIYFHEICLEVVDWIDLVQNRASGGLS
jgi:hypothetical protein